MPTLTKLYTMREASQHNTKDDCWVVIDGKVYDVSTYLDEHPGGDDVMVAATGKDATDEFEDAGHSKSARELMETFCIGELDPASPPAIIPELEIPSKKKQLEDLTKQYWTVPVTVVGVSVVFIAALYCWRRK
ncbi:Cytochrome b5 isoform A [Camellia lanceoleosa]|uniref:Cytochrome b5 isoform A n=1 Tax=Camellia lanceoleosa TaxID=1840588 RepID=A0ACC0G3P2_9ERIC|nr:Cytochrome b5 isoform A [Camellia lanceoleosa]